MLIENDDFFGNLIKTIILIKSLKGNSPNKVYYVEEELKKLKKFKHNNTYLNYSTSLYYKKTNIKYAEIIHSNFVNNYSSYNSLSLLDEIYLKCNNSNFINIDKLSFENVLVRFFYNKNRKTETLISFYKDIISKTIHKNGIVNYKMLELVEGFIKVV